MKVLLGHNYYGSAAPSGENQSFEAERDMLRRHGDAVNEIVRHSDRLRSRGILGTIGGALVTPWNPWSAHAMRAAVEAFAPDVVHLHNTFPLLSPAVLRAIPREIPRVLTLHNLRIACPAALPIRRDRLCTRCLDARSVLPSLRFGCYRGSRIATAPIAAGVWLHRALRTWEHHVDSFIVLSEFQRDLILRAGIPAARTVVKPNFHPGWPVPVPWRDRGQYAMFAGRLYRVKGVHTLIRAWTAWADAPELRIVGGGPEEESLRALAGGRAERIRFLGPRPKEETAVLIARARLLVLPSQIYEGFPMVLAEAFAHGTPVATSDIPALASIATGENSVTFAAENPESLLKAVRTAWTTPGVLERISEGARASFERSYNEEVNYRRLTEIYAIAACAARERAPTSPHGVPRSST